jgi:hypothetical protein
MKRLLLALVVGAALAYGSYRYFAVVPELRAREVEQGQQTLQSTKDRLNAAAAESQKRADDLEKKMGGQ